MPDKVATFQFGCHASSNRCLTSSNRCHASSNRCLTSSNKNATFQFDFLTLRSDKPFSMTSACQEHILDLCFADSIFGRLGERFSFGSASFIVVRSVSGGQSSAFEECF